MITTLLQGDCLEVLKGLDTGSVQCVVTSPPYYGLRDYGTARWEGGDPVCNHSPERKNGHASSTLQGGQKTNGHKQEPYSGACPKCGAIRIDHQIGLEETPEAYTERLVRVFREVHRVLKNDGTLWLNLGDSYAGSAQGWGHSKQAAGPKQRTNKGSLNQPLTEARIGFSRPPGYISSRQPNGIKPKDLIGIPWMVAFALRADGWYLRSEIIWHKPNPTPESVKDRPTKSHEQIFLLSKSPKYFYNHAAIAEPATYDGRKDEQFKGSIKSYDGVMPNGQPQSFAQNGYARWNKDANGNRIRNKRSVWTVTTKPYLEAHFATFPPDLIKPCILAGSRVGDTVLDPFSGSGTTGEVSVKHERNYIGIDLNPAYIELSRKRLAYCQQEMTP